MARRLSPWLQAFAGYTALTLCMTWPLVIRLSSAFVHDAGDPAFATWILWRDAHTLPLTAQWWNAPIYWPAPGAFAYSEHLLGISVVTTPLQWLGASPIVAYNIAFLLQFPLAALCTHGLTFVFTKRHDVSALAGLIFAFNPYRIAQIPHIQVMWAFGIPLALMALHLYTESGRRAWLGVFAAAWLTLAAANGYYLLFFPVLFGCWLLWFAVRRPIAETRAMVATFIVASLPLIPVLWGYRQIHSAFHMARGIGEIEFFSADVTALFAAGPDMLLWHGLSRFSRPEGQLFPGALALVLFACAVAFAIRSSREEPPPSTSALLRNARVVLLILSLLIAAVAVSALLIGPWQLGSAGRPLLSVSGPDKPLSIALPMLVVVFLTGPTFRRLWQRRSALGFYTLTTVLMFVLALGPRVRFDGVNIVFRGPFFWLLLLPGFSELRAPARFGLLFVFCLAVAAALAFDRLTASWSRKTRLTVAALAIAIVTVESWGENVLVNAPSFTHALKNLEPGAEVVELPLGDPALDVKLVYRQIDHQRPLVNGWAGYDPPHYAVLRSALGIGDGGVLRVFARRQPLLIVVHHDNEFDRWCRLVETVHGQQVADDGEVRIYRMDADRTPLEKLDGAPLPIQSVTANVGADKITRLQDGSSHTEWNSERVQIGGEEVIVDLGRGRHIDGVRLTLGDFVPDYPRRLVVDCADELGAWQTCWSGSAGELAVEAVLEKPFDAAMDIPIHRDGVRRVRLQQTAADPLNGWSIAELKVLGR